jgi:CRP/FNR family cyclic AMP-dependent transcriptional regulator
VVISENVAALMQSPLVVEMNDAEISALARIVQIRDCEDGEVLVEEGESNSHLYVPISGKIAITKRDEHNEWNVLHTLRAGDLAGELSFMDGEPRYASLIANGPTRVLVLDRPLFEELLQTHPVVVYKAMRAIMRVAHKVQRRLSMQMVDMQHYLYRTGGKY